MGLPAANAELDGNVAYFPLNKACYGLHLRERITLRCGQGCYLLLDLRRSLQAVTREVPIPLAHGVPIGESV